MQYYDFGNSKAKLILLTSILASGLVFFSSTAMSIVSPRLQADLGADFTEIQWIINSQLLILSSLILITGAIGDRLGTKRLLNIGLGVFIIGTVICGISESVGLLLAGRVIQGLGAAFIVPQSLAIINNTFAAQVRGQAIGIWGSFASAVSIFAPILTGFITDNFGWQATFMIMFPLAALTLLMSIFFLKSSKVKTKVTVDWVGAGILTAGLSLLAFGLIQTTILPLILGLIVMFVFVYFETKTRHPLINFKVIMEKEVLGANIFTFLLYASSGGLPIIISFFLQSYVGKTAAETGFLFLPLIIMITLVPLISGKLADKHGSANYVMIGAFLATIGTALMLFSDKYTSYLTGLLPAFLLIGTGFGLFIPALTKSALNVESKYSGMASGLNNAVSRYASLIGISMVGLVFSLFFNPQLASGIKQLGYEEEQQKQIIEQQGKIMQIQAPAASSGQQLQEFNDLLDDIFYGSYQVQIVVLTLLDLGGVIIAYIFFKPKIKPA